MSDTTNRAINEENLSEDTESPTIAKFVTVYELSDGLIGMDASEGILPSQVESLLQHALNGVAANRLAYSIISAMANMQKQKNSGIIIPQMGVDTQ